MRIFRREWNSQIRFTAKLAASGETLGPTALTYLNRGEWLDLEVLKFYTHRQIEKFGLEDVVCYLAVDNDKMALNYVGGEMLTQGDMIASPDRKISTVQYCVCAMNLGEFHFVSLVSCLVLYRGNLKTPLLVSSKITLLTLITQSCFYSLPQDKKESFTLMTRAVFILFIT